MRHVARSAGSPFASWSRAKRLVALAGLLAGTLLTATGSAADGERIGLVLGGGGARGAAHVGVLRVLERERIPIHAIAGTSVGAIIGGLYAAGYSADEIEQIIEGIDWQDLFRDQPSRESLPMREKEVDLALVSNVEIGVREGRLSTPTELVQGQKLDLLLRRLLLPVSSIDDFDALPTPFRAIATDVARVEPVVFSSGDLALAIRASMAVPGAFAPVPFENTLLVDGGFVDNVPISVARSMGVDRLIVVNVGEPLAPPSKVHNSLQILMQVVSRLMQDRTNAQIAALWNDDVLLVPELGELTSASFPRAPEGFDAGETAAIERLDQLRSMSVSEPSYVAWQAERSQRRDGVPAVQFAEVRGDRSATAALVEDHIDVEPGEPLDVTALERDVAGAYGRGTYERISYRFIERDGATGLEIVPVDKAWGPLFFRPGLQINDDFTGGDDYQLNVEARLTGLTARGAEWRSLLEIGRVFGLTSDFYLPFGRRGAWFVKPLASYTEIDQPLPFQQSVIAEYRVKSLHGELELGRDIGDRLRLSVALVRGQDNADLRIGPPTLPTDLVADTGGVRASVLWDDLDSVRFPSRGSRVEISYSGFDTALGSQQDGDLTRITADVAFSAGANSLVLGARGWLAKRPIDAYQNTAYLGGLANLSGLAERELIGLQQLLVRGIYYRRLGAESQALFSVPMYLAASLEGGNVWNDYDDVSFGDLLGAGSVFLGIDLPIGPLQLGYGRAFDGRQSFYLMIGSLYRPRFR
jgi:NTE family protein